MPKSRHRKNQKKKSRARTEKVVSQQKAFQKKMEEEFMKKMEEVQNKDAEIQEVSTDDTPNTGSVEFDEIKK
jgi:hypothetical protein